MENNQHLSSNQSNKITFYIEQAPGFTLGNFVMCTPAIQTLYQVFTHPIPICFSERYIENIYKDWEAIEVIHEDDIKQRNLTRFFGTNLINNDIEDYKFIHQAVCQQLKITTLTPWTYAPKLEPTDKSDYAVFIRGCLPGSNWTDSKDIPSIHYKSAIDKIDMKIKFIGSLADYDDYLKPLVDYAKTNHDIEVILQSTDLILREINGAKIIITNDTGWYHVAGALKKVMFCFWKDTPFKKNLVPGNNCTYSQKESWGPDLNNWFKELESKKIL